MDTAGFILLSGIFTAHVTGNFVLAGAALAGQHEGSVAVRLGLFPVFMLAVMAASSIGRHVRLVLSLEAMALLGFSVLGSVLMSDTGFSDLELFAIASIAVIAMGLQNALMREGLKTFLPTTMMTGNTTQFTLDLYLWWRNPATSRTADVLIRLRRTGAVLGGFFAGAAAGALGAVTLQFWSACIPAVVLLVLALNVKNDEKKPA